MTCWPGWSGWPRRPEPSWRSTGPASPWSMPTAHPGGWPPPTPPWSCWSRSNTTSVTAPTSRHERDGEDPGAEIGLGAAGTLHPTAFGRCPHPAGTPTRPDRRRRQGRTSSPPAPASWDGPRWRGRLRGLQLDPRVGPDGPGDTGRAFRPPRSGTRRTRALPRQLQRDPTNSCAARRGGRPGTGRTALRGSGEDHLCVSLGPAEPIAAASLMLGGGFQQVPDLADGSRA